jgi:hypothetical protein
LKYIGQFVVFHAGGISKICELSESVRTWKIFLLYAPNKREQGNKREDRKRKGRKSEGKEEIDLSSIPTVGTRSHARAHAANESGKQCGFQGNQRQKKTSRCSAGGEFRGNQRQCPSEVYRMSQGGPWNPENP